MRYIDINKQAIPYQFDIRLNGKTWTFEVRYNLEYDFFTVDLSKQGELIIAGEKVVYGKPLFSAYEGINKPSIDIIPLDLSGSKARVGWEELGETVFLYLVGDSIE